MRTSVEGSSDPTAAPSRRGGKLRRKHRLPLAAALVTALTSLVVCVGVALAASSPTVSTGAATAIGDTSAVLGGAVVPAGAATNYVFEYGPTSALGSLSDTKPAGDGTVSKAVTTTISGLTPGTGYYYRIQAGNPSGAATGDTRTFHTAGNPPPGATTGATESLTTDSVTMTGVVYPQGQLTTYYFRYGPTILYGLQTAAATVPAAVAPVAVTAAVPGLEPGLMFHYQLVAVHGDAAPSAGLDASFETYPSHAPKPRVTSTTTPRASRGAPFTLLTSGRIVNATSTPALLACVGTAEITFRNGRRTVARMAAPVQPNCTYAGSVTLRRLPGHGARGSSPASR
jgi:hypothetical protein